jgi:hypothetical protein
MKTNVFAEARTVVCVGVPLLLMLGVAGWADASRQHFEIE